MTENMAVKEAVVKDEEEMVKKEEIIQQLITKKEPVILSVKDLVPSPLNTYEVADLEYLMESLEIHGLISPLSVIGPREDGKYEILAGCRRYQAICEINKKHGKEVFQDVACYLIGNSSMNKTVQQLLIEVSNLEVRDFNRNDHRLQVARLVKQMADDGMIEQSSVAKRMAKVLSIDPRYSRMYLSIAEKGTDNLIHAVIDKKTPLTVQEGSIIAGMPDYAQNAVVKAVGQGIKAKEASKAAAEVLNQQKEEKKAREEKLAEKKEEDNAKQANLARPIKGQASFPGLTEDIKTWEDEEYKDDYFTDDPYGSGYGEEEDYDSGELTEEMDEDSDYENVESDNFDVDVFLRKMNHKKIELGNNTSVGQDPKKNSDADSVIHEKALSNRELIAAINKKFVGCNKITKSDKSLIEAMEQALARARIIEEGAA